MPLPARDAKSLLLRPCSSCDDPSPAQRTLACRVRVYTQPLTPVKMAQSHNTCRLAVRDSVLLSLDQRRTCSYQNNKEVRLETSMELSLSGIASCSNDCKASA